MRTADVGQTGEEFELGLEPEDREVYEWRVETLVKAGATMKLAKELARSDGSLCSMLHAIQARASARQLRAMFL